MNTKKKRKGSLFTMLTLHFTAFTLVVALLALGALALSNLLMDRIFKIPSADTATQLQKKLEQGSYASISAGKLLGRGSFFQVVDENGAIVYSGNAQYAADGYTPEELLCIPEDTPRWYCRAEQYRADDEKIFTVFSFIQYDADATETAAIVLDSERRIITASKNLPASVHGLTQLSAREYDLLQGIAGEYSVSRLPFIGADKQPYTAVLFYKAASNEEIQKMILLDDSMPVAFLLVCTLTLLFFVSWLSHRVKKPLALLSGGMQQLADGNCGAQLQYRGPVEFEQMCGSFNRMSARLLAAEASRQKAESDKQKMLADISHDLKTPITVIQGYAKAINDGLIPPEQQHAYLDTIYRKSTALTELVNTFYDYSRLEHPEFKITPARKDLCEAVREYLAERYGEIELADFALEADIPEAPVLCELDLVQLRRVFENLLSNALKHNPAGTRLLFLVDPQCDENMPQNSGFARVVIADSGIGIEPELRPHIFEAFVVGEKSRTVQHGSGLGLAVSKKIVEAHGGEIRLLPPENGWNTRFEIRLPRIPS